MRSDYSEVPVLIAQSGPLKSERWGLKHSLLIGRDKDCDIVIPDRQISRHHAKLRMEANGVWLEDLGSKNGTHCNGQPVHEPRLLQDGDIIQIALAQKFVYLSSDATLPLDSNAFPKQLGQLRLDEHAHRVWIREQEILPPLSLAQFRLLEMLYARNGRVVPRRELKAGIWEKEDLEGVTDQAFDALVRRLRDRLAEVDPDHQYIVTWRGHGLRLDNPPT